MTAGPQPATDDVTSVVAAVVAAVLDEATPVGAAYSLAGCDSIDLVEIAERVEDRLRPAHPGIAIDDAALARCTHVGELARLVESSLGPVPSAAPGRGTSPSRPA